MGRRKSFGTMPTTRYEVFGSSKGRF